MDKLVIRQKDVTKLTTTSLSEISKIINSGIVNIQSIQKPILPATKVEVYLYLKYQQILQRTSMTNDEEIIEIADQIIINPQSLSRIIRDHIQQKVEFLDDEIIEAICDLYPLLANRFSIEGSKASQDMNSEQRIVKRSNTYAMGNILKLIFSAVNKIQVLKFSKLQSIKFIQEYLFPFYFSFGHAQLSQFNKQILQHIKRILTYQGSKIQQEISLFFGQFYISYWTEEFNNQNMRQVSALENQLTLLQMIHFNLPYSPIILNSKLFQLHIKKLLEFTGQTRGSIHHLTIKVYENLTKNLNQYNSTTQTFINLFNILSSYGSHLIRDVWQSIYTLIQSKQYSIFAPLELIDILFIKLQHHENSNVIKNCIQQLLTNENSNILFVNAPAMIYNSLIRLLNLGVHYIDAMFHMDSKSYNVISNFFLKFYNSNEVNILVLENHFKWLLESIDKLTYDHALIAIFTLFSRQKKQTQFMGYSQLEKIGKLLKGAYGRYPIRKRFQLVDNILNLITKNMNKQITIQQLLQFLININEEYLIEPSVQKIKLILKKFDKIQMNQWLQKFYQSLVEDVNQNVIRYNQEFSLNIIFRKIKIIQLMIKVEGDCNMFYQFFIDLIQDFGQSQYKNKAQRYFIIMVYDLIKHSVQPRINQTKPFSLHLQAVLNSIVLYNSIQQPSEIQYNCQTQTLRIISALFYRTYGFHEGETFKEREGERVILARMLQWAKDHLQTHNIALSIIIQGCRARVKVLFDRQHKPSQYTNYEHLFQQTLYEIFQKLQQIELSNWQSKNQLSFLSRDKQLRLKVLLSTILMNDSSHRISKNVPDCHQIGDYIDRYDFESYEEVCWLISMIYQNFDKRNSLILAKGSEEAINLTKQLELLVENMIHNLQYSLGKKQISAICETTITALFSFAYENHTFEASLSQFAIKLIKIGESYLIFQRMVANLVIKELYDNFQKISQQECTNLVPLIIQILTIQEYRGFDSAVYLYQQNMHETFYKNFKTDVETCYYGAVPRFLALYVFQQHIFNRKMDQYAIAFLSTLIETGFDICMTQVVKQKMFLSGKNKRKLQMWQFLLSFNPLFFILHFSPQKLNNLLIKCIDSISLNSITQIRYYSQLFLMRILIHPQCFKLLTSQILEYLRQCLFKSIGNLNKSVAYIIVSGILVKHISQMSITQHEHFGKIMESFIKLYNSLLTYVGSSVAYFRGLSQLFCLQNISGCLETKYISILRENYLMDNDAINLKAKLTNIIDDYVKQIRTWQISTQILRKIPNYCNNVISDHYYMDIFKKLGAELAKTNKNEDGFTAYRYIWKKHIAQNQKEEDQQLKEEQQIEQQPQDDEGIFQRKIDPTLDYLYGKGNISRLKIMITSAKSQALIGHLARTGEIFGIQQLIIPCIKTIELDQFKSISVTAERWLNITDLGAELGKNSRSQQILKMLIKSKSQGYEIVKLSKQKEEVGLNRKVSLPHKCMLVLDEQHTLNSECLQFVDRQIQISRFFSLHVQASILIWSYFKSHINDCK